MCYDHEGNPVIGWSYTINYELAPGTVLVDIDSDTTGDVINPINDLELLYSAYDGQVHSIDLPGDFHPEDIQWDMYRFNNRGTGNWLRDYTTIGWKVFDNKPEAGKINVVYDWNREGRVSDWTWIDRYNWMWLIYVNMDYGFGITPSLWITGSSLVLVDHRTTPDNSKMLLSFKNYSPRTRETVQVTDSILVGKVVEDILNSVTIEDPCDGTIGQTLQPDGHSLLLAYSRGMGIAGAPTPIPIPPPQSSSSTSFSTSPEIVNNTSSTTAGENSRTTVNTTSTDSSNPSIPSSPPTPGSATLILLNEDEDTQITNEVGSMDKVKTPETNVESDSKYRCSRRSYVGNKNPNTSPESGEPIGEIPPLYQFYQAIKEVESEIPGIIKTTPQIIKKECMEKMLHPKPTSPENPFIWIEKILNWINTFIKRLNLPTTIRDILRKFSQTRSQ